MSDSSKVTVNYFCVGALLIFVGCVLICSLGFTIVLPYELTKNWPEVKCRVLNSSYNPFLCSCEEGYGGYDQYYGNGWIYNLMNMKAKQTTNVSYNGAIEDSFTDRLFHHPTCSSKFPCLQILVEFHFSHSNIDDNTNNSSNIFSNLEISALNTFTTPSQTTKNRSRRASGDSTTSESPSGDAGWRKEWLFIKRVIRRSVGITYRDNRGDRNPPTTPKTFLAEEQNSSDSKTSSPRVGIAYLYRSWDDSFHSRCSLIECGDEIWNVKENRKFRKEWGVPGKTFTCFYNPTNFTVVIKEKTSPLVVLHAILWPTLSLLTGAIIWICLCCGCCKVGKDSSCKEKYKLVT